MTENVTPNLQLFSTLRKINVINLDIKFG